MNLIDLIKNGQFIKTGEKKRLTLPGAHDRLYEVYEIPLDYLYYNDQNGRINTTYMKYKSEKPELVPERGFSKYNDTFEKFIYESDRQSLKKTLVSIQQKGQQEPGVVLQDGRIIDGNRRYTAIRMDQKNNGTPQSFRAIVLPFKNDSFSDKKIIKELELDLQLGREEKVKYDPIDRIFDIYNTIEIKKQMTPQEYAKAAGFGNASSINRDLRLADLIIKFIENISPNGDPVEKFFLAKDLKLDGPLQEVDKGLNSLTLERKQEITDAILIHMALSKTDFIKEEPTKSMRSLINNVIRKPEITEYYLDAVEDRVDIILDAFSDSPAMSANDINFVIKQDENISIAAEKMANTTKTLMNKGQAETERTKILIQLVNIRENLEFMNPDEFDELTLDQISEAKDEITFMRDILFKLRNAI